MKELFRDMYVAGIRVDTSKVGDEEHDVDLVKMFIGQAPATASLPPARPTKAQRSISRERSSAARRARRIRRMKQR